MTTDFLLKHLLSVLREATQQFTLEDHIVKPDPSTLVMSYKPTTRTICVDMDLLFSHKVETSATLRITLDNQLKIEKVAGSLPASADNRHSAARRGVPELLAEGYIKLLGLKGLESHTEKDKKPVAQEDKAAGEEKAKGDLAGEKKLKKAKKDKKSKKSKKAKK